MNSTKFQQFGKATASHGICSLMERVKNFEVVPLEAIYPEIEKLASVENLFKCSYVLTDLRLEPNYAKLFKQQNQFEKVMKS